MRRWTGTLPGRAGWVLVLSGCGMPRVSHPSPGIISGPNAPVGACDYAFEGIAHVAHAVRTEDDISPCRQMADTCITLQADGISSRHPLCHRHFARVPHHFFLRCIELCLSVLHGQSPERLSPQATKRKDGFALAMDVRRRKVPGIDPTQSLGADDLPPDRSVHLDTHAGNGKVLGARIQAADDVGCDDWLLPDVQGVTCDDIDDGIALAGFGGLSCMAYAGAYRTSESVRVETDF
jgi:hypothetical protein